MSWVRFFIFFQKIGEACGGCGPPRGDVVVYWVTTRVVSSTEPLFLNECVHDGKDDVTPAGVLEGVTIALDGNWNKLWKTTR